MPRKKRGPGQPPLGKLAKSINLQVRITPVQYRQIFAAARSAGVSVSEWCRGRILGEEPAR